MSSNINPTVRNILAVIVGLVVGGLVNMGLINLSQNVITMPAGANVNDMESIKSSMHLFEAKHFLFPFLAHALGTLVGAFVAAKLAANHFKMMAIIVGVFYLIGGIAASIMLPAPVWFIAVDLVFAYIPMAWLGWKLAGKK